MTTVSTAVPAVLLRLKGVSKKIGARLIVNDVDLTVKNDQVVGLFGPNGAGKTTIFYLIAGILRADSGQTLFCGKDISRHSLSRRAAHRINYLAQESSIFRHLSVYDNIMAILEYRSDLNLSQRKQWCERLIQDFDLNHVRHSLGITLSGGERRRAEIARLLASNPRIVLMDEPFAGIDPISIRDTKKIIGRLRDRHISVLLTDHNIMESLEICDYVYIFNEGRVIARGAPAEIIRNPLVNKVYLGRDREE